jgi:serine/threonine-protein kinase
MNYLQVDSNRWEEMKSLFEAALLRDPQEWPAFLASCCGDDTEFAAEIQRLLIADRESSQFLGEPLLRFHNLLETEAGNAALQPHQILCGRFEIIAYLGEGGMGLVFEALDLEINQHIAIKALRSDIADTPGALSRFKREVFTTLKVTHPNVCRTFDLECHTVSSDGTNEPDVKITFLTMELLKGETLAQRLRRTGPLSAELVHELAVQVANALLAAHSAGIVHCDLKPSNIFLTGSDSSLRAVVTDFGIAKVIQSQDQVSSSQPPPQAARSGLTGTPAYMAPEQFKGGQCTPGSDIYSFGLVVYEALTGERFCLHSRTAEEFRRRLGEGVDDSNRQGKPWGVFLSECLQTEPDKRFSQVHQAIALLQSKKMPLVPEINSSSRESDRWLYRVISRWSNLSKTTRVVSIAVVVVSIGLTAAFVQRHKVTVIDHEPGSIASVAVLPFANKSGDAGLDALGESVAANLTNELANVSGLTVPSQTLIASLGKHPDLSSLSRQLQIGTVVDGSIVKAGDDLLVQVALVDTHTGAQRWGQSYTRNRSGLPALEQDISQEIAFQISLHAGAASIRAKQNDQTASAAAQTAFLKGKEALAENTPAGTELAVKDFQLAIDSDSQYAPAFAQLAKCYLAMANYYNRPETANDLRSKAESAARRALQLDSTSADAYTNLAKVQVFRSFDWTAAERNFSRALLLDPGNIPAHLNYGFFLLTARGRFAEARTQYGYADRVIPKAVGTDVHEALAEYFARQYSESIKRAEDLRNRQPDIEVVVEILSEDYIAMNESAKAVALLTSYKPKTEDAQISRDVMLGIALAKLGQKNKAQSILREIERSKKPGFDLPFHLAALSAAVGDRKKAFEYLDQSYNYRQTSILFLGVDTLMDPLRPDPRFHEMLEKLNLNDQTR